MLLGSFIFAQDKRIDGVFRSQTGPVLIIGLSSDTLINLESNQAIVMLNYETSELRIKIDPSSFKSGKDSLDRLISAAHLATIEFLGRINETDIRSNNYAPLDFKVEGEILNTNTHIIGKGHLKQVTKGSVFSCVLSLDFIVSKKDIGIPFDGLNVANKIQVKFTEIVLENQP